MRQRYVAARSLRRMNRIAPGLARTRVPATGFFMRRFKSIAIRACRRAKTPGQTWVRAHLTRASDRGSEEASGRDRSWRGRQAD